jgi:ligand-binding sensor domain-containing protein
MRLYRIIYLLFFSTINMVGFSQNFPSKNITINDGLPSNTIRCIFKDSRGLLWIGTEAGLCCFDGKTFKIYDETNGLKHDKVWSIVEDEQNNIWLSLYGNGLAKYDGKTFTYFNESNGLVNNSIRKLAYSQKHKCLVVATEKGLGLFDGKHFKSFIRNDKDFKFQITGINEWNDNYIITSSRHGVYELKISATNIQSSTLDSLFYSAVCYSSFINDNIYYAGDAEHNLIVRDLKTNKATSIPCPIVWDYAMDKGNSLYCATFNVTSPEGGLYKYSNNKLTNISKQANIDSKAIWCLFYDKETQLLWVGTEDKGLYKVDLSNRIQFLNAAFFGLNELQIQELYNDANNNTWIGAKDYIIKLKPDLTFETLDKSTLWNKLSFYFKTIHLNPNIDAVFTQWKIKDGFSSFNIISDKENHVWISTTWGLICLNSDLSINTFYGNDGGHFSIDNKNRLFYGHMYSDIFLFNDKFNYQKRTVFSIKNKSIPRDISKIINDGKQTWYASITNGLYMSRDTNFFWINKNGCFKENTIKDLIFDSKQNLVIGTNNGRVYIAKAKVDSIEIQRVYSPNKELYGSSVSFIEESENTYFIGTNKGINIIKNNQFVKLINQSEGINDLQFNDCIKNKNGNLWIATNNGLFQVNTNSISTNPEKKHSVININSIKVNGQNYLPFDTLVSWNTFSGKEITLNYNQNELDILFSNNNSFNADKNMFRYKIIGLSDNWSEYESLGRMQLRAMPTGNYQLIIEGKNIGTGEIFEPKEFKIIITPPFWKTKWFIITGILFGITLLYMLYRIRINAINEKAALTNKLLETRLDALRAQMNPHFTFNAINSIQNFIIDNNTTQALHYLGEFAKLIRQTLENATEKLMSLHTEINFLNSYIEVQKMRFDTVQTSLTIDSNIDKYNTQIPPLILQPFIENAFEHAFESSETNGNKIDISFKFEHNLLVCTIKDNGKGFNEGDSHTLHKSKGLQLTLDRLNLLNKEYNTSDFKFEIINLTKIDSTQTGTQITITFPLIINQ